MNQTPSPHPSPPLGERVTEGRVRGILRGSGSQCAVAEPWRLSHEPSIFLRDRTCSRILLEVAFDRYGK